MIAVNNVSVLFGGFELFSNINFMINKADRIGLVGKNGAGKSTLLKIIDKQISQTTGTISMPSDITIGYLPQQMPLSKKDITVFNEALTAFDEILNMQKELNDIHNQLSELTDFSEKEHSILDRQNHLISFLQIHEISNIEGDTEKVLHGLGFSREDLVRKIVEFSGGWRMRIELAKILLKNPDVLLLDEPTNHLDIEAIQWLEEFIENYKGALLLISHDRAFLDNVTKRTIEINNGKIFDYKVSYSHFKILQQERIQQQTAAYENQQKLISDTEKFIEKFRYKATKANQVQSRIKQLDKIDLIEIDDLDNVSLRFKFPPAPRSGDIVIETTELSKHYGKKCILKNIDLVIERGEKVAFIGRNGEGKTTLSKVIVGDIDYGGTLKIGHNVKIGYFAQNQDELLDPELTVFETLDNVAIGDVRTKLRDILGSFLFSNEDIDKKIKVLSGGERSRLSLAKLLLEPYNLLILDEPTNHLDMRSKDILKQALQKYDGTLILVSHDRYFLDGLVNKIYEFKNQKISLYIGGIYDFLQKRKLNNLAEIEIKNKIQAEQNITKINSDNKILYFEKKEKDKQRRILQNKVNNAEKTIENLEKEIEFEQTKLNNSSNLSIEEIQKISKNFSILKSKLENEIPYWELYCMELEDFDNHNK
ncbi:MAG: ATP-binding cassette domain-containing protein [Bacteroidales bacterium]|jgi:ATP-binding cassette subfamily F protein 3|nr:ATP-binding cassette domain-containing protein [Bacteroidales bacterium]